MLSQKKHLSMQSVTAIPTVHTKAFDWQPWVCPHRHLGMQLRPHFLKVPISCTDEPAITSQRVKQSVLKYKVCDTEQSDLLHATQQHDMRTDQLEWPATQFHGLRKPLLTHCLLNGFRLSTHGKHWNHKLMSCTMVSNSTMSSTQSK